MRDGWRETTLGEVATRTIGRTPPRNDPSMWATSTERPFVTIADLGLNRTVTAREGVSELAEASGHAKRFPAGSLLLSFKLSIGRVGVADRDVFTNEAIARLAPVDGVLRDFLAIALENVNWDELGGRAVKGKTMNKSSLDLVPIALPPLDEQRRIVDLIASVDEAVDAAEAEAARTRSLEASITAEHFASIEHAERLGALATSRLGKMLSKAANQGEDAPYLRNVNVRWGSIDTSDLKTMPFTEADHTEFALNAGDVLVCEGGEIARAAVLDEDLPGIYFQKAIHRVRCGARLRPHYLQRFLAHAVQNDLLADYVSGSTIKHLTGEKLARVPVPLAELEDQDRLIARTDALRGGADAARATADALRTLRSNLLTVLLSGEHEIPASYDALLGEVA